MQTKLDKNSLLKFGGNQANAQKLENDVNTFETGIVENLIAIIEDRADSFAILDVFTQMPMEDFSFNFQYFLKKEKATESDSLEIKWDDLDYCEVIVQLSSDNIFNQVLEDAEPLLFKVIIDMDTWNTKTLTELVRNTIQATGFLGLTLVNEHSNISKYVGLPKESIERFLKLFWYRHGITENGDLTKITQDEGKIRAFIDFIYKYCSKHWSAYVIGKHYSPTVYATWQGLNDRNDHYDYFWKELGELEKARLCVEMIQSRLDLCQESHILLADLFGLKENGEIKLMGLPMCIFLDCFISDVLNHTTLDMETDYNLMATYTNKHGIEIPLFDLFENWGSNMYMGDLSFTDIELSNIEESEIEHIKESLNYEQLEEVEGDCGMMGRFDVKEKQYLIHCPEIAY